ncbi:hypothetical protein BB561_000254 [Smittium simulii]|uniref:Rab-GAP TBC domain-containing protein n=1 Tax=Smittium simulii TaxID=133385 RepID=A0A2T9YZU0_9FUNG|nr:hypothetical protein BB561_000254 [Smittium simulii]
MLFSPKNELEDIIFDHDNNIIDVKRVRALAKEGIGNTHGLRSIVWRNNNEFEDKIILQILRDVKRTLPENDFLKKFIAETYDINNTISTDFKAKYHNKANTRLLSTIDIDENINFIKSENSQKKDKKNSYKKYSFQSSYSGETSKNADKKNNNLDEDEDEINMINNFTTDLKDFAVCIPYIKKYKHEIRASGLAKEFLTVPPKKHMDIVARILFMYACLNKSVGYVQGMNEMVAIFYYTLVIDAPTYDDLIAAEADTFFMVFNSLSGQTLDNFIGEMDEKIEDLEKSDLVKNETHESKKFNDIQELDSNKSLIDIFSDNLTIAPNLASKFSVIFGISEKVKEKRPSLNNSAISNQGGIQRLLWKWWNDYLSTVDPDLWRYMSLKSFNPQDFALRWLLVWCAREFELSQVLRIWDSILSDQSREIFKNKATFNTNGINEDAENEAEYSLPLESNSNSQEYSMGSATLRQYSIPDTSKGKKDYQFIGPKYRRVTTDTPLKKKNNRLTYDPRSINSNYKNDQTKEKKLNFRKTADFCMENKDLKFNSLCKDFNKLFTSSKEQEDKSDTNFLLDFCVAMLISIRKEILRSDFSSGMMIIQSAYQSKSNKCDVKKLLEITKKIQNCRIKYQNNLPLMGIIDEIDASLNDVNLQNNSLGTKDGPVYLKNQQIKDGTLIKSNSENNTKNGGPRKNSYAGVENNYNLMIPRKSTESEKTLHRSFDAGNVKYRDMGTKKSKSKENTAYDSDLGINSIEKNTLRRNSDLGPNNSTEHIDNTFSIFSLKYGFSFFRRHTGEEIEKEENNYFSETARKISGDGDKNEYSKENSQGLIYTPNIKNFSEDEIILNPYCDRIDYSWI